MQREKDGWAKAEEALRFEIGGLTAPPTMEEARLLEVIEGLRFVDVPQASAASMEFMQTRPQHCHANARWFEEADPFGKARSVTGWWRRGNVFYLHSVVYDRGQLVCITPGPDVPPLWFAPDTDIQSKLNGHLRTATRWGRPVPSTVRRDPAAVIARCDTALKRLEAGEHPLNIKTIEPSPEQRTRSRSTKAFVDMLGKR